MKTQHITFIISIILFCSCNLILSRALGVRSPKPKSINYISRFAQKKELGIEKMLVVADTFILRSLISRPAQDLIFLSDGSLVDKNFSKENPECSGNGMDFIKGFIKGKKYPTIPNNTWKIEQTRWQFLDGSKPENLQSEIFDLNIVYYWGSFIGKSNLKRKIDVLREHIKSRPDLSINFILVNIDIRKGVSTDYEDSMLDKMLKNKENSKKTSK